MGYTQQPISSAGQYTYGLRGSAYRILKADLQSPWAALTLEQISNPRIAVVHALAHLIGSVAHVNERHKGEYDHNREQQEAHEDDRE